MKSILKKILSKKSVTIQAVRIFIISIAFLPMLASANCNYKDFDGWKDCFVKEKLLHRQNSINIEVFRSAEFLPNVIQLDQKQPEKQLTFSKYKQIIKIDDKIIRGKKFYKDNKRLLNSVSKDYNVEPEVLVALIGIESDYGTKQGNFNIIDSLATLAYEGRRKNFFEKELINALTIANSENMEYSQFKGSWAGAMGQCQFMPSSYLSYAVDYDNDGMRDIWNSREDVVASAANYLKRNGWQIGTSQIKPIKRNKSKDFKDRDDKGNLKLISLKNNDKLEAEYMVGKGYDVIMKWNRSSYFALSVLTIAEAIKMDN